MTGRDLNRMGKEISAQVVDSLPYPVAVFTAQYELTLMNKAFMQEIQARSGGPRQETIRILPKKIDDLRLALALRQLFMGKSSFVDTFEDPFSIFSCFKGTEVHNREYFHKVALFPIPGKDGEVNHGVIVFLRYEKRSEHKSMGRVFND